MSLVCPLVTLVTLVTLNRPSDRSEPSGGRQWCRREGKRRAPDKLMRDAARAIGGAAGGRQGPKDAELVSFAAEMRKPCRARDRPADRGRPAISAHVYRVRKTPVAEKTLTEQGPAQPKSRRSVVVESGEQAGELAWLLGRSDAGHTRPSRRR